MEHEEEDRGQDQDQGARERERTVQRSGGLNTAFRGAIDEAAMSTADTAKKFGFSRASGFEDLRDGLMEQLAVGSEKILGVSIAESNLGIFIV